MLMTFKIMFFQITKYLFFSLSSSRQQRTASHQVQPPQTQTQSKTPHTVHHPAAALARKEIPRETIPEHSRARRILIVPPTHRDAGENLVPKSPGEGEATARSRTGENQNGRPGTWSAGCPAVHGLLPSQPDGWCHASWVERAEFEPDTIIIGSTSTPSSSTAAADTAHITFIAE